MALIWDQTMLMKIASTDEFASLTSLAELSALLKIAQAISEGATGLRVM